MSAEDARQCGVSPMARTCLDYAVYVAVRIAVCVVQALPLAACRAAAGMLATVCCDVVPLRRKVIDEKGRCAELARSDKTPEEIVEELYLLTYCRPPDAEERKICLEVFGREGVSRRQAAEDVLWALLNTPEFIFKD